jgi:hypothetical protein
MTREATDCPRLPPERPDQGAGELRHLLPEALRCDPRHATYPIKSGHLCPDSSS